LSYPVTKNNFNCRSIIKIGISTQNELFQKSICD
jgi:hypothetical protein